MNADLQVEPSELRLRRAPLLVISFALVVLGGMLVWSALDLRERIRTQIVARDGEILDAVTAMQRLNDKTSGNAIATLDDPGEQFHLALEVSRLRNVLGVRLFDRDGKFVNAFPAYITEGTLPAGDIEHLSLLKPASHFSAEARLQDLDLLAGTNSGRTPVLTVEVPLREDGSQKLSGTVQFLMDGSTIAQSYAELDRNLALRFSAAFVVGAGILVAGLGLAVRRVQRANRLLAERTGHLLQANRELALAARTSAVGAVASHLIHGLKNPLSGLHQFVHAHRAGEGDDDWMTALSTTQRMQELVNRVVRVLQEQQSGLEYEISIAELAAMLNEKARPAAEGAKITLETRLAGDELLSNRAADLILLILENLVQNAIEASPAGSAVTLTMASDADVVVFEVRDRGPGLPPGMEEKLFKPGASSKKGGGGIGLAISRQLAQALGAKLELVNSNSTGCTFRLVVPKNSDTHDENIAVLKNIH